MPLWLSKVSSEPIPWAWKIGLIGKNVLSSGIMNAQRLVIFCEHPDGGMAEAESIDVDFIDSKY